jgi:hypothetical protein
MTAEESQLFIDTYNKGELNQETMTVLVSKTISINKDHIWQDALKEYGLIN